MNIKLLLQVDSRDNKFHQHFGQASVFPREMNFDDAGIPEEVQPPGDVRCTSYGICYVAQNLTKKDYVEQELFDRYPSDSTGANPRTALKEAIANGLLPVGKQVREKPFKSYWSAHEGDRDAFDNVRSAMTLAQSPCLVWTNWYSNWIMFILAVLTLGIYRTGGHFWAIKGWKEVAGEPMFIVEWWGGFVELMPRAVFNAEIAKWGCGTAILSTAELDAKRIKTLKEKIQDIIKNLILLYRELQVNQQKLIDMTPKSELLYEKAKSYLGKDATPEDTVDDDVACASSVNRIFKETFGEEIGGGASTSAMYAVLKNDARFKKTKIPSAGCIIISPTGYGNNKIKGHVGIMENSEDIMSNTSATGKWEKNFTLTSWVERYRGMGRLPIMFFELL